MAIYPRHTHTQKRPNWYKTKLTLIITPQYLPNILLAKDFQNKSLNHGTCLTFLPQYPSQIAYLTPVQLCAAYQRSESVLSRRLIEPPLQCPPVTSCNAHWNSTKRLLLVILNLWLSTTVPLNIIVFNGVLSIVYWPVFLVWFLEM